MMANCNWDRCSNWHCSHTSGQHLQQSECRLCLRMWIGIRHNTEDPLTPTIGMPSNCVSCKGENLLYSGMGCERSLPNLCKLGTSSATNSLASFPATHQRKCHGHVQSLVFELGPRETLLALA